MNEQNIDRLFKDKLAGYSQSPPSDLSDKLESRLTWQKRRVWIQFARLAAVFVLIAASIYLLTDLSSSPEQPISDEVATMDQQISEPTPLINQEPAETRVQPQLIDTVQQLPPTKKEAPRPSVRKSTMLASNHSDPPDPAPKTEVVVAGKDQVNAKPQRSRVTITYKKTAIRSMVQQESTLEKAQPSGKKPKKKKKFWRKAKMVDPSFTLAGLRTTKDQLLAINKRAKNKESKPN